MTSWLKLWRAVMQFSPDGAADVLETYLTVHRNKLGMHWLYAAAGRIAAGENERAVLADYGYEWDGSAHAQILRSRRER